MVAFACAWSDTSVPPVKLAAAILSTAKSVTSLEAIPFTQVKSFVEGTTDPVVGATNPVDTF